MKKPKKCTRLTYRAYEIAGKIIRWHPCQNFSSNKTDIKNKRCPVCKFKWREKGIRNV